MSDPLNMDELMTRDGITPEMSLELERKLTMTLEKKRREVRRIRMAVVVAWLLLICVFIAGAIIEGLAGHHPVAGALAATAQAGLVIAVFLTASWYVRSTSLRFACIMEALTAIQKQLAKKE